MSRDESAFTVENASSQRESHWLVKITEGPRSNANGAQDEACGLHFLAQVHPNAVKMLTSQRDPQHFHEFTFNKISPDRDHRGE